jgi:threonylcarbamoyladenosine tRNA methylthiotransferase MtaB
VSGSFVRSASPPGSPVVAAPGSSGGAAGRMLPVRVAAITNLGCKVNQSEMEAAARLLRERGVAIVDDARPADLYVVNTCTVTAVADQKSRQAVRRARRHNPDADVLVTGCSVQVGRDAIAAADPAARLIDNDGKARLLEELAALLAPPGDGATLSGPLPTLAGVEPAGAARIPRPAAPLDGIADDRTIADRTRAFVKVQDGCSFYCTYCIIPAARGPERSLAPEVVLRDIRRALGAGHREIVLTGINIGTYDGGASEHGPRGSHRWATLSLAGLVRRILDETAVERIRLSSIEPQHVGDELLDTWVGGAGRCLPHFHLPLQSGDDGVLRRMGRRYDSASYRSLVDRIRSAIDGVAIHADIIAGFPTEDEAAFRRTVDFLCRLDPAGLHVFRYSARPGTPATRMAGQVPETVRRDRAAVLLALATEARARFAAAQRGSRAAVLFETRLDDGRWIGHAPNHVLVAAPSPDGATLENTIGTVEVGDVDPVAPDRAEGRILALSHPRGAPLTLADPLRAAHASRRSLPMADTRGPTGGFHG